MPKASATKIISLSILSFLTTASAYTTAGCYSSAGQLTSAGTYQFQSEGYCQQICTKQNKPVFALHNGDECYCGDSLPPSTAKVSSTQCQTPCSGFPSETCGGANAWLINSTTVSESTTDDKLVTELKRESTDNVENGIVIAPESDDSDSSSGSSNSPDTMKVNPTMVETGIPIASSAADGGAAKSTVPSVILTAPSMTGVTVPATGAAAASSMVVAASSASASATATASGAASSGSAAASPSTSAGAAAAIAGAPASGMIGGVFMAAVVALGL
ncbi:hypothetical protein AtubIFM56815_007251 [Aspergillus tubingensis]|uniref:WSC domain-containing protein n=2 Tax=Aspergillus subgen. Circumdati TaxID=2720871 RepID=A0A100IS19_ASPNG|nr:hypothetical protein ASPNIDRAFT_37556 [Aspergillus niger]GLA62723.1 hypothetical protein AtubIFM54640_003853 [Aspergillus tubingensis]GLA83060.1 hypothetical protein AtubIFM56815_007251 [Aspergillus tubingensis]GLB00439.1 hypothetical protein AtubIFM57143_009491 [Aspergillus tubingensis]GLB13704.1 hypothetical protein AtubIFM61612_001116 [Aspergillus tubingensis]